ncbi:MAG TPA: DRTGG domain-containing protein [Syntrophorhabdaceae bacterium]|nr:DRTGG domain-containing protein [Syntrophorhabdaceae bacterium]HOL05680.1 DRTGG domain-containing protein [Syntrophorhabdaceae bacterium]HON85320.1 DRTGG domain-containing protein [Syntrophorhabdaceae bacterium]HOT41638.1 DRTGG domain-containing protein [Syntrophorhabdaceae bacterium]HPC67146.1 DRTGG domain-containing protein [Syntrophorhabdaceae bacterium]
MTLGELSETLGFEILTGDTNLKREIKSGYVSDLLSDVIANIEPDSVWITIQRHINILGVAKLKDVAAIIIPRNLQLDKEVIEKAKEENIAILRDSRSAFEISGLIYNALKKGM